MNLRKLKLRIGMKFKKIYQDSKYINPILKYYYFFLSEQNFSYKAILILTFLYLQSKDLEVLQELKVFRTKR